MANLKHMFKKTAALFGDREDEDQKGQNPSCGGTVDEMSQMR